MMTHGRGNETLFYFYGDDRMRKILKTLSKVFLQSSVKMKA